MVIGVAGLGPGPGQVPGSGPGLGPLFPGRAGLGAGTCKFWAGYNCRGRQITVFGHDSSFPHFGTYDMWSHVVVMVPLTRLEPKETD